MVDILTLLREEFEAADGSFLLRLRGDLEWDRTAFSRLEQAMRRVCERCQDLEQLDRWMAEGFYYLSHFVRNCTSHPDFPRPKPRQYYEACLERIDDLADWFFHGEHSYQEPHVWHDL